jgi:Skp family chaperone for outer membrane proteins
MPDILLSNAITWVLANATSIGAIAQWVTKPLRDKLTQLDERVKAIETKLSDTPASLGERLRELDLGSERCREEHEQKEKALEDLVQQLRELQQDLNRCVSDEEFKAYVSVANGRMEKTLETLGWIRGRMGGGKSGD